MKLVIFLLVLVFAVNCVKADDILNIIKYRDVYSSGETVQLDVNINGELSDELKYSNLKLLSETNSKIDVAYTIEKIDNYNYYIFFNLPQVISNGNYRFLIQNLDVYDGDNIVRISKGTNFSIKDSNYSISIYPGIIKLENPSSLFNVKNNLNPQINLIISATGVVLETSNLLLGKKASKDIQFRADDDNSTKYIKIEYGDKFYKIPVLVLYSNSNDIVAPGLNISNLTVTKESAIFIESSKIINKNMFTNETISAPLRFLNNGDVDIRNLNIKVSDDLSKVLRLNQSTLYFFKKGTIGSVIVSVNRDLRTKAGEYKGTIKLSTDVDYDTIFVYLNFTDPPKKSKLKINNASNQNLTNKTVIIVPEEKNNKNKVTIVSLVVFIISIIIFITLRKKDKPKEAKKNFSYYLKR